MRPLPLKLGQAKFQPLDEALRCPALTLEEMTDLRQQCRLLLDAIFSMPPVYRDVFLLRKLEALSYVNISAWLGISEKTV